MFDLLKPAIEQLVVAIAKIVYILEICYVGSFSVLDNVKIKSSKNKYRTILNKNSKQIRLNIGCICPVE